MEFPRVVYFGIQTPGDWHCKVVPDAEACDQALAEGWTLLPTFAPVDEPGEAAEPVEKRKPGRPRKAK